MTLNTWDSEIAPRLQRVESAAGHITRDAQSVRRNVRELRTMPDFETKAGDQLHSAKQELEAALAQVNSAIAELSAKPIAA